MRLFVLTVCLLLAIAASARDLSGAYREFTGIYQSGSIPEAKEAGLRFLELAKSENDPYYLTKTYYILGWLSAHSNDYGNAVIYYLEGARFAELSVKPELKLDLISIYKNLGKIMGDYSHHELATKFINQAIKTAIAINDEKQIVSLLYNRIHELLDQGKYTEALRNTDSLLNNFQIDPERLVKLKNKKGIAHKNTGNEELAIKVFQDILQFDPRIAIETYSHALRNLGNIFLDRGEVIKALSYYTQTNDFNKSNSLTDLLFDSYLLTGKAYMLQDDLKEALRYFHLAADIEAQERDLLPGTYLVYEYLADAYESTGDISEALHYKNIYTEKLEVYLEEQRKIQELDKKYNIQLLTERYFDLLAANQAKQETDRVAKISVGGLAGLFVLILLALYYRQRHVKRSIQNEIRKIELLSKV